MDVSWLSLLMLVFITVGRYVMPSPLGKPVLTTHALESAEGMQTYQSDLRFSTGLYVTCLIVVQVLLSIAYTNGKCGGVSPQNVGMAIVITLFPWALMFGSMLLVLGAFPAVANAFSDVVGYFSVSGRATALLQTMLRPPDKNLEASTQQLLMKLYGNLSILINQFHVYNFSEMWTRMQPLMNPSVTPQQKQALLDITMTKDNVGEAMWCIYTGILVSSFVFYNLATRNCVQSPSVLEQNYKQYLEDHELSDDNNHPASY